jgi:hypothetical protein
MDSAILKGRVSPDCLLVFRGMLLNCLGSRSDSVEDTSSSLDSSDNGLLRSGITGHDPRIARLTELFGASTEDVCWYRLLTVGGAIDAH